MNIAVVSQSLSCQHMAALSPPLLMRQRTYSVLLLSPSHTSMVPPINQQSLLHPHPASHNRHKSKRNKYTAMQASSSLPLAILPQNIVIISPCACLEVLLIAAETCCSHHNIALTLGPPFSLTLLLSFLRIHTVGPEYGYKALVNTVLAE